MLVQFQAEESESIGEINWLVQNGWNGPTEKQVSLSFQNDGIYFQQADALPNQKSISWLDKHDKKVVLIVFEFDLGAIGQDTLKVYVNPKDIKNMTTKVTCQGELTFDRLQFKVSGRTGGVLKIDEVRVSKNLEDIM